MSEPLRLSGQQKILYEAIAARSTALAQIYLGVVQVIKDENNPDRVALAAHGVREMMDHLPQYFNLAAKFSDERLGNKVNELVFVWNDTVTKSSCRIDAGWDGAIDTHLRTFLVKFEKFAEWDKEAHPKRVIAARRVFQSFDPLPLTLPPSLEDRRAKEWMILRDFFTDTLHHRNRPELGELQRAVDTFERFLLDRIQPPVAEDLSMIDRIIQQGEAHD